MITQNASATLSGATFEGNDGNIVVGPGPGGVDWANLVASGGTLSIGVDQQSGTNDNSFTQGSKEDDVDVDIGLGSIPNNKADIGKFGVGTQTIQSGARAGNVQMFLAWIRNNDGGTTNFDFEINQVAQPDMTIAPGSPNRSVHLNRTGDGPGPLVDDVLINYDLQGGASTPTLTVQRWQGTQWGQIQTLTSANSEGRINCVSTGAAGACPNGAGAISQPDSGPFNQAIAATRFGEAAIDLTAIGIIPNQNDPNAPCISFGSAYVKSRASSAFNSQMKDYSAPIAIGLDTCASIEIRKVTDPSPDASNTVFDYTRSGPGTLFDAPFTLSNGGSNKISGLSPGSYSVTEAAEAGWDFTSLVCNDANGTVVGATANITLDANEDVVCTYTNTQRGTIEIEKQTDPAGSTQAFNFNPSWKADFQLTDDGVDISSNLVPGAAYSITEDLPAGWTLIGVTCSDGSLPGAIDLDPGETVRCTFNNQARGNIIVEKQTDPDGSTQEFPFDVNYAAPLDGVAEFSLVDGGTNDSGSLLPGTYAVDELTPAGWEETSAVCSDGSLPGAIGLDPGETVRCIFSNEQDAQITLVKQTLNGEAGEFEIVTNYAGTVVLDVPDDPDHNSGPLDPGTYSAVETVPTGWLLVNQFCSDGSAPGAISLQAGEHVICTFVNERQIGSIDITKVRKHAAEGPGDHPHAGVTFTVSGPSGSFDVVTDATGHACVDRLDFGTYSVTEHNPGGYADNDPQNVDVNTVDYCASLGGGGAASFSNTPLTDLTVAVNSQVDGGTASTVTCTPDGPSGSTNAVGDFSGTTTGLAPGTYTCVIFIDP